MKLLIPPGSIVFSKAVQQGKDSGIDAKRNSTQSLVSVDGDNHLKKLHQSRQTAS